MLPEWRALTATSARSPLEAPDWQLPLAQAYHGAEPVRFLAWRRGEQLVGVAPFGVTADWPRVRPLRQLALWGNLGSRMRGMVDVVAQADARDEVLDGLCAWLRTDRDWDVLRMVRPQFGSTTPARLKAAAANAGWIYAQYANVRSTTFQLALPQTLDEWEGVLASKTRRTQRWQGRKFAELRGGRVDAVIDESGVGEALDATQRLLATRWGEREVYFHGDPKFRPLLDEALPRLMRAGAAWLSVARDDAGVQACLVTLALNGYAMSLLLAATSATDYRPFSLGNQVFDQGIREAIRRGCHTYDFLWAGGYKENYWHAEPRLLESAVIGRGVMGRAAARLLARRIGGS